MKTSQIFKNDDKLKADRAVDATIHTPIQEAVKICAVVISVVLVVDTEIHELNG